MEPPRGLRDAFHPNDQGATLYVAMAAISLVWIPRADCADWGCSRTQDWSLGRGTSR